MASSREVIGEWSSPLINLKCVAVHVTLLPSGKILYWGRRADPKDLRPESLNEHFTTAFLLDPKTGTSKATGSQPMRVTETGVTETVNLFCSGHALQPDGTVFVAGGHLFDSKGVNQACVYDPVADHWTAKPLMNNGRWYPSVLALPNGGMLVMSGTFAQHNATTNQDDIINNNAPQIWKNNAWHSVPDVPLSIITLFPRMHLDHKGQVFVGGTNAEARTLVLNNPGDVTTWSGAGPRRTGSRDQASSVKYDRGKIMYVGGDDAPTNIVEFIDLTQAQPTWTTSPTSNMAFKRRQHNATVLPDGTVLVTGGSQGNGFNNTDAGQPVHTPELFNPKTNTWTKMAPEQVDRCYHGTAILLPDGRVMSGGNGEYELDGGKASLANAQFFSPPYLFIPGARPSIKTFPATIDYKQKFDVILDAPDSIARVSWARLGSVTHCTNMNQSLMFLQFDPQNSQTSKVTVTAPDTPNDAPPGHYMLFLLNARGQPSVAPIIQIKAPAAIAATPHLALRRAAVDHINVSLPEVNEKIHKEQKSAPVVLGITSICPYGLGACWGGAFDALQRMSDIHVACPVPDASNSTTSVYLNSDVLPDIDVWRSEFSKIISNQYVLRGIEMTLSGILTQKEKQLTLAGTSTRPDVVLAKFRQESKIQYDNQAKAVRSMTAEEAGAYDELVKVVGDGMQVQVTGTLQKHGEKLFSIDVRGFAVGGTQA